MKPLIVLIAMLSVASFSQAQKATISEQWVEMNTYSFYDPNPVVNPDRIYPYFRFDGYKRHGVMQAWKMVVLENEFIKVFVCPDIGGKVWGAIEKSTGKEFLYYNHSVKFRDVAMRGAWSSGGLEYNFGDIGHIPTCATPVDYMIKENEDGSVACVVGAIDLPSGSRWNVEIKLEKDKAFFETIASWHNTSDVPVTYYHWMNAAAKAAGDLEFIYPGNKRIGHGGEVGEWPFDNGRHIAMYEENNFGIYKSYHIINKYSNFFGGYWHKDKFGFGHYADYDDKPGRKIWIWGLSDQGMIWEDLLSDGDGQYIEYQAGKLFNQAAHSSTFTPFKHREFLPFDSDVMRELWFPLKDTEGMVAASEYGILNTSHREDSLEIFLSPLQPLQSSLVVTCNDEIVLNETIDLRPLQLYKQKIGLKQGKAYKIEIGKQLIGFDSKSSEDYLDRPVTSAQDFNWSTAYGKYTEGLELEKQRRYAEAEHAYTLAYEIESTFMPVIGRLALLNYRKAKFESALGYSLQALAIDTYDPLANYVQGLIKSELDEIDDAMSAFSIASQSIAFRSASLVKLAELSIDMQKVDEAIKYAKKALLYNQKNLRAFEILVIAYRLNQQDVLKEEALTGLFELDPCNAFVAFENNYKDGIVNKEWLKQITNELPHETILDLAVKYHKMGLNDEAIMVLESGKHFEHPIIMAWLAFLDAENRATHLAQLTDMSAKNTFPHRKETLRILSRLMQDSSDWRLPYFSGIISWHIGCLDDAKSYFEKCGEQPDFVAFYLSKMNLFDNNQKVADNCLKRAFEIDKNDWRLNLCLIQNYINSNELQKAEKLSGKYHRLYPENSKFGMLYANSLLRQKKYEQCLSFLEKFEVMPYEGATEGRNIYHEVCLRLAFRSFEDKSYRDVIEYAKRAKEWPLNLGVGKHYDVDERLDDYLIALAYAQLGKEDEARKYYNKIINHRTPKYLNESSKLLWQVLVLNQHDQKAEATSIIQQALNNEPDNLYVKWVNELYLGEATSELLDQIANSNQEVQAYDTKFIDVEFIISKNIYDSLVQLGYISKFNHSGRNTL
ncbi:DUF5107 domain-containing protein [Carboxylicivirga mesophila]|uniref:DUF5107 domain-containing protein n=1 Tax=Carboxylicivirga mesophila TaxID=1166478 RepID=A0ABS5KEE5_9BACT|nr:DUF5107 domain-containing protein [Carboxylicivirga mesophila]MBS2212703.1 DUF5107 domain-containing protein [Carboxylicivirga mesophila]